MTAIELLEQQIGQLTADDGYRSIKQLTDQLASQRKAITESEKYLVELKAELLDLEAALALLKAGERP